MTLPPVTLQTISPEEFGRWQPSLKVIVHDHPRRFAAVELPASQRTVAISWRSDAVDPVVVLGRQSETWVGVDQRVACIGDDGRIVVSLGLASSVLDICCSDDCNIVVCETEALVFNRDYSVRMLRGFTDLPCEVVEQAGKFIVTFADGRKESIA